MTEICEHVPAWMKPESGDEGRPVLVILAFTTEDPFAVRAIVLSPKEEPWRHLLSREGLDQALATTEQIGEADAVFGQTDKRNTFHITLRHTDSLVGDVDLLFRTYRLEKLLRLAANAVVDDADAEARSIEDMCSKLLPAA